MNKLIAFSLLLFCFSCLPKAARQKNKALKEYHAAVEKINKIERDYPDLIEKRISEEFTPPEELDSAGKVEMDTAEFDKNVKKLFEGYTEQNELLKSDPLISEQDNSRYKAIAESNRELLKKIRKGAWKKSVFPLLYLNLIDIEITFDPDVPYQISYKGTIRYRVIEVTKYAPPRDLTFWEKLKRDFPYYIIIITLIILHWVRK